MDPGTSSSASCRIVVVSSSIDTSREVAQSIKAFSGDSSESESEIHPSSEVIHWTIKNKYYTAPVHFHPIHIEGLEFIELDDVPAVIYAWKGDEPYRMHMKQVFEQTSSSNPEVSLAISMTPTTDEELENFFFEHGFEYVEGHLGRSEEEAAGLSGSSSSTPGMRRAVDALSTIMWPSMVRNIKVSSKSRTRLKSGDGPLLDDVEPDEDVNYRTLIEAAEAEARSEMQREMEMLEKWLEEEEEEEEEEEDGDRQLRSGTKRNRMSNDHDPWFPVTAGNGMQTDGSSGFDDDFTEFVSAPDSELPSEADVGAAAYASLSDSDDEC